MKRRTVRIARVCDRRITRRAFVRRAGLVALAMPSSFGLLTGLAGVAVAAPAEQASTATPTSTAPASTTTPPAETPVPTSTSTLTPTSTVAPSLTLTPTPDTSGRPMPSVPGQTGPTLSTSVTRETVLTTLRLSHPRLMLLSEDEARIRRALTNDVTARSFRDALLRNGSRLLTQPTPERVLIGPRLLTVSRTILDRVMTLALLYRLDGDRRWAARAREELLAAAAFSDWNPSHFLDVAEMTHAFALGYDWLYDFLSVEDRATIRRAIVEKGLRPAEQAYASRAFWARATHNWNLVCNGGIAIGALAIGDEEPGLAGTVLAQALTALPAAIATYAPDGAWPEGPAYWEYGTLYLVSMLAALNSALGTDFGLSDAQGLSATGRFRLHVAGPTGLFFNFADANPRPASAPMLFWLGRRHADPALAVAAREAASGRSTARDLLWYDASGSPADIADLPLDARYQTANLAFFRSAWNDKDAIYVGFKGGDNAVNHSHLDLGTFVLDALGQRWAVDLGPDDYDLPGYFGAERFTYERIRTSGQNTLLLDGADQDPKATAPLTSYRSSADGGFAIADLTAAYAGSGATRVNRGVSLRDNRARVLIQDEVETSRAVELVWAMHTQAAVEVQGDRALLTQGGAVLEARLLSPAGATFTLEEVEIPPPQQPASDVRRLLVRLPGTTSAQIAVLFTPRRSLSAVPPGTVTATATFPASGTTTNSISVPGTTTPLPIGPSAPAAAVESMPPPEIVNLSRWAISADPEWDSNAQT
ncbi:MAG TPA: heparinase II/III family protein [Chloroflexota bacterium]|nr:heparinase II/III family protein [Chloroflexota bacterium]